MSPTKKMKAKAATSRRSPKKPATKKAAPKRAAKAAEPKKTEIKIAAAKGRPMLTWVGKHPLQRVTAFPAQLVEKFDPLGELNKKQTGSLLFHGDNKEVLAYLLANGYRGKIDLIYIDPPFDSGADYVRKVTLRGVSGAAKLSGETYSLGEQIQYTDIWANDNYLQFMYERLLLLKELMANDSVIYLHADPNKSHLLRCVMDEVFGQDCFRNEIVWWYWNKFQGNVNHFAMNHDTIFAYRKGKPSFKKITEEREEIVRQLKRAWDSGRGMLVNVRDDSGNILYQDRAEKTMDDVWRISMLQPADETENLRFPTQKPEDLLNVIVASSSKEGALVLDCFVGSGTTAAVAQKLGRRWIGCDINQGAIQTTSKRLQTIIEGQIEAEKNGSLQGSLIETEKTESPTPAQLPFAVYRVNDYDLQIQHNEAVNLACEHIGIKRTKSDSFFEGELGKKLVKIIPFNHPLSPLDLEQIKNELAARPDEDRDVAVVSLGKELAVDAWLEEWNRYRKQKGFPNKIEIIELRTDERYGKFFEHKPAQAKVEIKRDGGQVKIRIRDFISPTIVERLEQQAGVLTPHIEDWRSMVDSVMIDTAYDGKVFNVTHSDVPQRKNDLVIGEYELDAPKKKTTVAVKITDMLGEEVLESIRV